MQRVKERNPLEEMMAQGEDPSPGAGSFLVISARHDVIGVSVLIGVGERLHHKLCWCYNFGSIGRPYLRDTQSRQMGRVGEGNSWDILWEPGQ